jgi:hypothetical protein
MLALTALMMSSKRKSDDTLEEPLLADDVQAGDVGSAAKKPKGGKFSRKNQPTPKKKVAQPAVCVPASSPATSAAAVDGTRWGHPIQSGQTCGHNMCRHNGSGMLRVPYNRRKAILEATGMSPEMAAGEHARYMCPEHLTADAVPGGAAWAVHVLPAAQDPIVMAGHRNALAHRRSPAGNEAYVALTAAAKGTTPPKRTTARSMAAAQPLDNATAKIAKLTAEVHRLNQVVKILNRHQTTSSSWMGTLFGNARQQARCSLHLLEFALVAVRVCPRKRGGSVANRVQLATGTPSLVLVAHDDGVLHSSACDADTIAGALECINKHNAGRVGPHRRGHRVVDEPTPRRAPLLECEVAVLPTTAASWL